MLSKVLFSLTALVGAVAASAAPDVHKPRPIVNYGMLLFPAFTALDVFAPMEALQRVASNHTTNLYLIADTMEPVGTRGWNITGMNPHDSNVNITINPTHTFKNAPPLDVLMIPGGIGTRAAAPALDSLLKFVRKRMPTVQYLFTICTGSAVAAQAGVLDGHRATTNKAAWAWATKQGPKVNWISHARWIDDGKVWTTSGVSAGGDGFLAFISAKYSEEEAAIFTKMMEWNRVTNASDDPFADDYGLPLP